MEPAPEPIPAYQLIYTNVEAELSPTRQRGFQVWLSSPELTAEQRRATAKRLDDFRLPPGVGTQDTTFARYVFFQLADCGLFVIARTVASAERDKFGRAGKFHAHALLLSDDVFCSLGCNPFRVIDGGFRFQSTPAEAMEFPDWKSGQLPQVAIQGESLSNHILALPGERLSELIDHVERADEKPVVIPDHPERVLAALRGCFAVFPPCVRRKVEFDTHSTGSSLTQIHYAIVGAYSSDQLRTWVFRRYHRLDLANGTCTPALSKPVPAIPSELVQCPGWGELNDAERDVVFRLGQALGEQKLDDIDIEALPPTILDVLTASPGFASTLDAAIQMRMQSDVPQSLLRLTQVAEGVRGYFTVPHEEALRRLRTPIPRDVVAHGLYEALGRTNYKPDASVLAELDRWLAAGSPPPRLEIVFRRWRGKDTDLDWIEGYLSGADDDSKRMHWFREWLASTLPEGDVTDLIGRLEPSHANDPDAIRDARLWLTLNSSDHSPASIELRLLTALHRGPDFLRSVVTASGEQGLGWLVRATAARLRDRFQPAWMVDAISGAALGLFVSPERSVDETLLEIASEIGPTMARRVLQALWPIAANQSVLVSEAEPMPPPAATHYHRLLEADARTITSSRTSLCEHLHTASDEAFRWVGNQLLQKVYGEPVILPVSEDVYAIGLKLVWVQFDRPAQQFGVFEALAGSLVSEIAAGDTPEVGQQLNPRVARRFTWLLARLANPAETERLPV